MIASVISAATLTPILAIDQSNSASSPARTFSSRGSARWPVRKRMRSAMRCKVPLAARQSLLEFIERFDHLGRFERFQSLRIVEIDAAWIHLDHALRRLRFQFGRSVAGEDDRRNPALAGLREHVGREIVRDPIHAFGDRIGCRRRQDERVVDTVIEEPDRRGARRRVAEDACGLRQDKFLLVHAHDLGGRLADEEIDLIEIADHRQAFLEEVPGPGKRPAPARRFDLGHGTRI